MAGNESATVATISVNSGCPFTAICDAPFDASAILPVVQALVRRLEDIHATPERKWKESVPKDEKVW